MIVAGAVYTPFTTVPTAGLSSHVTAVLPVPVTEALKVADCPLLRIADAGATVTLIGCKVAVALAVLVESASAGCGYRHRLLARDDRGSLIDAIA